MNLKGGLQKLSLESGEEKQRKIANKGGSIELVATVVSQKKPDLFCVVY